MPPPFSFYYAIDAKKCQDATVLPGLVFSAARRTCAISTVDVTAPTPPGTGVIAPTVSETAENPASPQRLCVRSFQLTETSSTV